MVPSPRMRLFSALLLALSLSLAGPACKKDEDEGAKLRVGAAASLSKAYEELGEAFTEQTGTEVEFVFQASGNLATQIESGAPYDVYAPAAVKYIDQVIQAGAADQESRTSYAVGRLVLWVPEGAEQPLPSSLEELADERYEKIALANPKHAPYGVAAERALQRAGVWDQVKDRVVYGSNVRQAMSMADTKNADVGFIALSLALGGGEYLLVDDSMHAPLEQEIVVLTESKHQDAAAKFVELVASDQGQEVLRPFGLLQPGESPPTPR